MNYIRLPTALCASGPAADARLTRGLSEISAPDYPDSVHRVRVTPSPPRLQPAARLPTELAAMRTDTPQIPSPENEPAIPKNTVPWAHAPRHRSNTCIMLPTLAPLLFPLRSAPLSWLSLHSPATLHVTTRPFCFSARFHPLFTTAIPPNTSSLSSRKGPHLTPDALMIPIHSPYTRYLSPRCPLSLVGFCPLGEGGGPCTLFYCLTFSFTVHVLCSCPERWLEDGLEGGRATVDIAMIPILFLLSCSEGRV
ncbi:hypothetical protein CALVIDRAFT_313924 [Calocera viscosa TUFC12733]|uniref:Uncharacterized protein n=1 Tax=Calocera viscosa (strain TUFC12733) TaxID=1330018 RepID=A0A167I074_CALVF|nr:hypothetical protein CALVIDRAFT_313924 [Calocera viscosa TUFC12733]